jgi:thiol-disulfide isomerase/thioredoxin
MEKPPLFETTPFADAVERARIKGVWLIVDATAEWCGPCRTMDQTTWRDDRVASWVAANGLAVQVDVDAESELARQLEIRAMPTIIAFKDGDEKDRVVGYRDPAGLLDWLDALGRGETDVDRARHALTDPEGDMNGRLSFARTLLHAGQQDEATDHYVWLWHNMARVEPAMAGVRVSFMAGDIEALAAAHPPARERFARIRDELAAAADAGSAGDARLDWIVLNKALSEEDRTIAWFDAAKDDPSAAPALARASHHLVDLLRQRKRWADIGRIYADPVAEIARNHEISKPPGLEALEPAMRDQVRIMLSKLFRDGAALLYGCLRAAGRGAEAEAVEREAERLDPSDEMKTALVAARTEYVSVQ